MKLKWYWYPIVVYEVWFIGLRHTLSKLCLSFKCKTWSEMSHVSELLSLSPYRALSEENNRQEHFYVCIFQELVNWPKNINFHQRLVTGWPVHCSHCPRVPDTDQAHPWAGHWSPDLGQGLDRVKTRTQGQHLRWLSPALSISVTLALPFEI